MLEIFLNAKNHREISVGVSGITSSSQLAPSALLCPNFHLHTQSFVSVLVRETQITSDISMKKIVSLCVLRHGIHDNGIKNSDPG